MLNTRDRRLTDLALLVLAALMLAAVALPGLSSVRPVLALLACCFLPGAAVLTLIPVRERLTWALVAVLLSLAALTITSLATLWLGAWHPRALAGILLALSVVLLGLDLYRAARRPAAALA